MASPEVLRKYVQDTLKQGHSERDIRKHLEVVERIPKEHIDEAFMSLRPDVSGTKPSSLFNVQTLRIIVLVLVVLLFVYLVILAFSSNGITRCEDRACFIERANACKPATYELNEVGSTVLYEIKDGCVLEKGIIEFSSDEPDEIVTLFSNKTMRCAYTSNSFDEDLLTSVVTGVNVCTGELAEAIIELKLAQFELLG